eukprot:GHVN01037522.1.p1 GENE.GHVN01037522.1~~GHVN01037522.1.p1  ORF type:complete len:641 (+),score=130.75 GHVN01037522.1:435-2357(+)
MFGQPSAFINPNNSIELPSPPGDSISSLSWSPAAVPVPSLYERATKRQPFIRPSRGRRPLNPTSKAFLRPSSDSPTQLACASWDGSVRVWVVGEVSEPYDGDYTPSVSEVSEAGALRATVQKVFQQDKPRLSCSMGAPESGGVVRWSPNSLQAPLSSGGMSNVVFSGGCDNLVTRHDIESGQMSSVGCHDAPVSQVILADGRRQDSSVSNQPFVRSDEDTSLIASCSWDSTVKVWDPRVPVSSSPHSPVATVSFESKIWAIDVRWPLLAVCQSKLVMVFDMTQISSKSTVSGVSEALVDGLLPDSPSSVSTTPDSPSEIKNNTGMRSSSVRPIKVLCTKLKYQARAIRISVDMQSVIISAIDGRVSVCYLWDHLSHLDFVFKSYSSNNCMSSNDVPAQEGSEFRGSAYGLPSHHRSNPITSPRTSLASLTSLTSMTNRERRPPRGQVNTPQRAAATGGSSPFATPSTAPSHNSPSPSPTASTHLHPSHVKKGRSPHQRSSLASSTSPADKLFSNRIFPVNCVDIDPQRHTVATGSSDGYILLFNLHNRTHVSKFERVKCPIVDLKFNSTGSMLAYALSYDWHKGHSSYKLGASPSRVYIHTADRPQSAERECGQITSPRGDDSASQVSDLRGEMSFSEDE